MHFQKEMVGFEICVYVGPKSASQRQTKTLMASAAKGISDGCLNYDTKLEISLAWSSLNELKKLKTRRDGILLNTCIFSLVIILR